MTNRPIRVANCSGFFGDRLSAAREMVEGGPIDVLSGDYLAELTMAILARHRMKDAGRGFVPTFLVQLEEVLGLCLERGVKVVANAGGLNPEGLAGAVAELAVRLGFDLTVATVAGDDMMGELGTTPLAHASNGALFSERGVRPVTANAYLGGWGIAEALERGADVVVTGRVADASLVVGPAAWHHQWARDDWDALAGAVVAGHVIECGAQVTGGNYSFFAEIPQLTAPGFPIAEVAADGSSVVTKHPDTGGAVSAGTVTAQLLYEVGGARYLNPDVVARLDTIRLTELGADAVGITEVRGEPPPPTTKVAATAVGGFRNSVTFLIAGLDVDEKAAAALDALWERLGGPGSFDVVDVDLMRTDQDDPPNREAAFARLQVTVSDRDPGRVGRAFSNAAVELALASYPGFTLDAPPGAEKPLVVYWPSIAPQRDSLVAIGDWSTAIAPTPSAEPVSVPAPELPSVWIGPGNTIEAPIGRIVGARSGDKGGDANLGVWTRTDVGYRWLLGWLTTERLREMIPEAHGCEIERHPFPNVRAINFVLHGYLGEGVATSTQMDPQAKALGEYFRAKVVEIPEELLAV